MVSCLGRVTPGVKDTPFLGSARGVKEAVDLFTRRKIVGDEREQRKGNRQTSTQLGLGIRFPRSDRFGLSGLREFQFYFLLTDRFPSEAITETSVL